MERYILLIALAAFALGAFLSWYVTRAHYKSKMVIEEAFRTLLDEYGTGGDSEEGSS